MKKKNFAFICLGLCLIFSAPSSWADLNSATYKSAKEAYDKGDCETALVLLEQYRVEYIVYLSQNPVVGMAIYNAINYCEMRTPRPGIIVHGVISSPKPTLP